MKVLKGTRSLVFGLLFSNTFKILDQWGEIADGINEDEKFFPGKFFPNITHTYTIERELSDPVSGNNIRLTPNNLIYTQSITGNFNDEFKAFKNRIAGYLEPQIIRKYNLVAKRLGIVYTYELSKEKINKFASYYFNPNLNDISDFRFSKKEPTKKAAWSENNDYINKIYTVGELDDETQGISYDYQLHFEPFRPDIRNILNDFFVASFDGFQEDIINKVEDQNVKRK